MSTDHQALMPIFRDEGESQIIELQRSVDYDTRDFTVEYVVDKFNSGEIFVPEYQRNFVWPVPYRTRFIESLLLGLPIPYMFFAEIASTGKLEIVDGAQRIHTMASFLGNDLELDCLEKLTALDGFRFHDLTPSRQIKLKNRALRIIILSELTDEFARFDVFERINTGSLDLRASELRKGAYPGGFYDLLRSLAQDAEFRALCPLSDVQVDRGEDEELVLRFFCYADSYRDFKHDVKAFLNSYLKRMNDRFTAEIGIEYRVRFHRMLDFVKKYFAGGFGKTAKQTPRVRFEAISVGSDLALQQSPELKPRDTSWIDADEFETLTTSSGSNSRRRLAARIEFVRNKLLESA